MADIDQLAKDLTNVRVQLERFEGTMSERMDGFGNQVGNLRREVERIAQYIYKLNMKQAEERGAREAKAGLITNWRRWLTPIIALVALLLAIYDKVQNFLH